MSIASSRGCQPGCLGTWWGTVFLRRTTEPPRWSRNRLRMRSIFFACRARAATGMVGRERAGACWRGARSGVIGVAGASYTPRVSAEADAVDGRQVVRHRLPGVAAVLADVEVAGGAAEGEVILGVGEGMTIDDVVG